MSQTSKSTSWARTEVLADGTALVTLGGVWSLHEELPDIIVKGDKVQVRAEDLGDFDSSLPSWLYGNFKNIRQIDLGALPPRLQALVQLAEKASVNESPSTENNVLERFGNWGVDSSSSWSRAFDHIGNTA